MYKCIYVYVFFLNGQGRFRGKYHHGLYMSGNGFAEFLRLGWGLLRLLCLRPVWDVQPYFSHCQGYVRSISKIVSPMSKYVRATSKIVRIMSKIVKIIVKFSAFQKKVVKFSNICISKNIEKISQLFPKPSQKSLSFASNFQHVLPSNNYI